MQKITIAILTAFIFLSCDYSTTSNGNIDAAFAREAIPSKTHEGTEHHGAGGAEHHEGGVDAATHPDNDAKDHMESAATQKGKDELVVPADSSESPHNPKHK